jgi:glycosyltransferase involved in cell wall biosynthesis
MKLLYILGNIINRAGVERIMTQKMNYLAESGIDVTLLTTDQNNHPISFPLSNHIRHASVKAPIPSRSDFSFIKWLLLFYKSRNTFFKEVNNIAQEMRPDIIVCTTYSFDVLDLIEEICHRNKIKLVIESHIQQKNVFMKPRFSYNRILELYGKAYDYFILRHIRKADKLVCLTDEDKNAWERLRIHNVHVIPNMITIQPPKLIDYSAKRVIAVGRYSHQKGFDMLIKVWGRLSSKYPDWHLYIFGNEDRSTYEEMAIKENCQDSCHCMPVTEKIVSEYAKSSIFVMSSRYEGMPLALIEAMSSGLACVSFRCPNGPSDIIQDGIDGYLAKNGDIDDLADKIENLICNEPLRKKMGEKARQNIERYSPEAIMQQNKILYNTLISQ